MFFFNFFFSLSQALGKPKPPSGVWGSPCVSSSCTSTPPSTRTSCSTPTPRPRPRTCFFFPSSSLVFRFGVWLSVVVAFSVLFVVFQERKLRANRTHPTRTLCFCSFFFVPAAQGLSPVLAVRPFFLAFCRGAILGPGRFFGFSRDSSEAFSWTRSGMGASWCFFLSCVVFPLLCCLRLHTFS